MPINSDSDMPPVEVMAERWSVFNERVKRTDELIETLRSDIFTPIKEKTLEDGSFSCSPAEGRSLVRAFGTFIDGVASGMGELASAAGDLFGRPLNSFLQAKVKDQNTSTFHRLKSNYRLVEEFLPDSPLARIPDSRWENSRSAISLRNRVVHPRSSADLVLYTEDLNLVINLAVDFSQDFRKFSHWLLEKEQKLVWKYPGQRRRVVPKVGRNDPCLCGSARKSKHCCGPATDGPL